MSTEPGRTGRGSRRHSGEATPSDRAPEDEEPVGEAEAEPAVTEGVYFSKVSSRDVWHAHDEQHDHIGTVYREPEGKWLVKAGGKDMPATFGSAASARAFLSGYHLGQEAGFDFGEAKRQQMQTHYENVIADLRKTPQSEDEAT